MAEEFPEFAYYQSALVADVAGRTDVALFFAEQAMDRAPSISGALLYASLLSRTGDAAGAQRTLEDLLAAVPDQPQVVAALAALAAGGTIPATVTDVRSGTATVFFSLATAIMQQDGGQTSIPYFQLSLRLWPDAPSTAAALGELLQDLGRQEQAIDTFALVRPIRPSRPTPSSARREAMPPSAASTRPSPGSNRSSKRTRSTSRPSSRSRASTTPSTGSPRR